MKRRILAGGAVLVLGGWIGLSAWSLSAARAASIEAVDGLAAVADDDELGLDDLSEGTLSDRIAPVEAGFRRADAHLNRFWMGPARHLPVLGRQLRSASALTALGADLTGQATELLDVSAALLDGDGDPAETIDELARLLDDFDALLASPDLGPDEALFAALADARARAADVVDEARFRTAELASVIELADTVLADQTSWLLLVANNAEMRVGSGMILQAGVLTIDAGDVGVADLRPSYERNIDSGAATIDADVARNWEFMLPSAEWRQLGLTPRFDATAMSAAAMYEAAAGESVDGVVLIDPFALEAVLGLAELEPADVGISSGSVTEYLLIDQYAGLTQADQDARRDQLGRLAGRILGALDLERLDTARLFEVVADLTAGRHLLAWSPDPDRQRAIETVGADGGVGADGLAVSVANFGATKLDPYLDVAATWRTDRDVTPRVARLVVEVENRAPTGLPAHVSGFGDPGRYKGAIVVSLPAGIVDPQWTSPSGAVPLFTALDGLGLTTVLEFELERDESVRAVVEMTLPDDLTSVEVLADARPTPATWRIGGQDRRADSSFTAFLAR